MRPHRNPFEVFVLAYFTALGAAGLVDTRASQIIRDFITTPFDVVFYALLAAASATALAGIISTQPVGVLVERAGLLCLTGLALTYGAGVYALGGVRAGGGGVIFFAVAVACVFRIRQINRGIQALRHALRTALDDREQG